jgi:hypothetical protein
MPTSLGSWRKEFQAEQIPPQQAAGAGPLLVQSVIRGRKENILEKIRFFREFFAFVRQIFDLSLKEWRIYPSSRKYRNLPEVGAGALPS